MEDVEEHIIVYGHGGLHYVWLPTYSLAGTDAPGKLLKERAGIDLP